MWYKVEEMTLNPCPARSAGTAEDCSYYDNALLLSLVGIYLMFYSVRFYLFFDCPFFILCYK